LTNNRKCDIIKTNKGGVVMKTNEVKIVKRNRYENLEFLSALQNSSQYIGYAIDSITYQDESLNKDYINKLKSYKSSIDDIYEDILNENDFVYKIYVEPYFYYEIEYFYTRSNNGKIKISTDIKYNGTAVDKEIFIQKLVEQNYVTEDFADHIVEINRISKTEYFVDEDGE
jgi:hypothetical protein